MIDLAVYDLSKEEVRLVLSDILVDEGSREEEVARLRNLVNEVCLYEDEIFVAKDYSAIAADDSDGVIDFSFKAGCDEHAIEIARKRVCKWVRGGDWGTEGALVEVSLTIFDDEDQENEIYDVDMNISVAPDHETLIEQAGGDNDCDHDWIATVEIDGGCEQNPGQFSHGGTVYSSSEHCRICGLVRVETTYGSQRNPGEHDTVEYTQLDNWCSSCECQDCDGDC